MGSQPIISRTSGDNTRAGSDFRSFFKGRTRVMGNEKRLLWAGFMAILAAGVGFAVRGAIFGNWAGEFGFTNLELGAIGGAGFTGFCFGIVIGGMLADKFGYGKLVILAFALHVLSAFVTFVATGAPKGADAATIKAAHDTGY